MQIQNFIIHRFVEPQSVCQTILARSDSEKTASSSSTGYTSEESEEETASSSSESNQEKLSGEGMKRSWK
jgi:hypothetical protein